MGGGGEKRWREGEKERGEGRKGLGRGEERREGRRENMDGSSGQGWRGRYSCSESRSLARQSHVALL